MDYAALSPEELVLACLKMGNEPAWREFVRRFQPIIAAVVLRVARRFGEYSSQVVDDIVQDTYLKLCRDDAAALRNFQSFHDDAIYGFIKVFAANLAYDHFKSCRSQKRGGAVVPSAGDCENVEHLPGTAKSGAEQMDRELLIREIGACLCSLDSGPNTERDRRVFWLYYRTGLSASAIAALPTVGLTTKGVESTLLRLTRQIRAQLVEGKQSRQTAGDPGEGILPAESL